MAASMKAPSILWNGTYWNLCEAALVALDKPAEDPKTVEIVGGNCYIRSEAGTNGAVLGVAKRGTEHAFGGEIARNGWIRIKHGDGTA